MEQKWAKELNFDEFNLISDTQYPLLKKSAMEKVKQQLIDLGGELPTLHEGKGYKISSGENLQDFPYLVLDFPRITQANFDYLFRTLFWWGHPVSYQVFLNQSFDVEKRNEILGFCKNDFLLTGDNIWENDFGSAHYKKIDTLSKLEINEVIAKPILKLVRVQEIRKPQGLFEEGFGFYQEISKMILTTQKGS